MKTLMTFLVLISSLSALAVDGLTIKNSFEVGKSGNVFRGREPGKNVGELAHIGITDVIIFKNEVKQEVTKEIAALKELGLKSHHIAFEWKDLSSMQGPCEEVIEALQIIELVKSKNDKVYFHCTAGEDRTGVLAGLFQMLDAKQSRAAVFKDEMCARGYADGNLKKPFMVYNAVHKALTPLFIALAEKIESGELKSGKLSKKVCRDIKVRPSALKCRSIE